MQLDGRTIQGDFYRHGFNGMEKDDEVKGGGNSYDFGARIYDSRVGRWLTIDPLAEKYTSLSPYNFVSNSPILFIDPDGETIYIYYESKDETGKPIKICYEYGSGIKLPNDRFVRRTVRALNKIEKKGLDPEGIISSLKANTEYNVIITEKPKEDWATSAASTSVGEARKLNSDGSSSPLFEKNKTDLPDVVSWNSNVGWISEDGTSRQSPACVLKHELGHKYYTLFDPLKMSEKLREISNIQNEDDRERAYKEYSDNQIVNCGGYENYADMWIIQKVEPSMHEGIRKSHSDGFFLKTIGGVFSQKGIKYGRWGKEGKVNDLKKGKNVIKKK